MSCGAALFNLRVAAMVRRRLAHRRRSCPTPRDRDLLATMRLHGGGRSLADVDRLHSAIELRRTHRDGFVDRALPTGLSDELRALARTPRAHGWQLLDDDERDRLADLVAEGDRMQWANRHWRRELAAWLHPRRKGDGLVTPELIAPLAHAAVVTLDVGMPTAARDRERAEQALPIVALDTHGDRPRDWLIAGHGARARRPAGRLARPAGRLPQPAHPGAGAAHARRIAARPAVFPAGHRRARPSRCTPPGRRRGVRWPTSSMPLPPDARARTDSVLLRSARRATDGCTTVAGERSS